MCVSSWFCHTTYGTWNNLLGVSSCSSVKWRKTTLKGGGENVKDLAQSKSSMGSKYYCFCVSGCF